MNCHIDFRIDGHPGHVMVEAPSAFDALLTWIDSVPEQTTGMKAIVRVVTPEPLRLVK